MLTGLLQPRLGVMHCFVCCVSTLNLGGNTLLRMVIGDTELLNIALDVKAVVVSVTEQTAQLISCMGWLCQPAKQKFVQTQLDITL